ncbi:malic enzyme [Trypanosoma cruzi]|uniref:Malic enzyme n=2 Tax=Trypanosoma cruzi TaxID=5693 RepID=Q4DV36_TRYCC|nr:malic enzyme, putative [Trypanosoma cruzi]EAN96408.1 malic enzyme, putative [Trypanosoma cruzi]KAF5223453.1 malic enzyme [Trypanosoma cruzi]KAF8297173.1 putative malic enzyme [Trypanosoma cruzi]PWV10406.1 malic enzyme [Trypanosoma cruzi]RNC58088.1 putative mitochondrial malic enzyme [Trypanosoma cruzi]|eukprot:XP_818259.1 malic enzyme [Trypanosoma cruzi strain CL Brener]
MTSPQLNASNCQGRAILTDRYINRGTAFTMEQRQRLHILGRLPPVVETLEEQVARVYGQVKKYEKPINRYQHLVSVHSTNTTLYYATILAHLEEMLPIIYTPTVGEACMEYSHLFFRERGVYFNRLYKGQFRDIMRDAGYQKVKVVVITDGSRILGLGDLGSNGIGISIGKCSLYVAGAGIDPRLIVPVILDVGTNTERYLQDKDYLGMRERRLGDEEFYELLDEFMEAASAEWPNAVIQFEDFSNNHCFDIMERYQKKYRCFNDDIQGTGAVIAAGFLNAIKLSGVSPLQQRIVVFGAGSAAVGVANNIAALAARMYKFPVQDLVKTFYLVDTKGLVTTTRGDQLAAHKKLLARTDVSAEDSARLRTLEEIVRFVKPTTLLGLGGVGPAFTEEIVKMVMQNTERPIIFPLSNPTSKAEVTPENAYKWTNGAAIVASGSPFPPTTIGGKTFKPSQGNNLYVFPGVGLGCALAEPTHIPDELLLTASESLNLLTTEGDLREGRLYPPLEDIHNISANVATDVILEAQRMKIDKNNKLPRTRDELLAFVKKAMWKPVYSGEVGEQVL